jgi:hypothetical protein
MSNQNWGKNMKVGVLKKEALLQLLNEVLRKKPQGKPRGL